jgi:hypothetical protein
MKIVLHDADERIKSAAIRVDERPAESKEDHEAHDVRALDCWKLRRIHRLRTTAAKSSAGRAVGLEAMLA